MSHFVVVGRLLGSSMLSALAGVLTSQQLFGKHPVKQQVTIMFTVLSIFSWLEQFTLPCIIKTIFHHDCPGCGFQRSVLLLLQGSFRQSWQMYPPAVPILLLFVYGMLHLRFKFSKGAKIIQYGYIFIALFVMINYIYKIIY